MVAIFIGCEETNGPPNGEEIPPEIDGAVWPLEVGNEWVFEVQEWNDSLGDYVVYNERYVVDTAFKHDGNRVAKVRLEYFVEDTVFQGFTFWWGNTVSGLYEYSSYGDDFLPYDTPHLLFKYPAVDGEVFQSYAPNPSDPVEMGFIALMPVVEVPAGSFDNCVGYQYYEPPGENIYYYFVPDTGYIQMEKYISSTLDKARYLQNYVAN